MSNLAKPRTPILIGDYQIDASLSETHSYSCEVTEYPVEQGSAISDNVRPKPIVVTIEGIVSDTPIGSIADLRNGNGDQLPSVGALAALLAIRDARQPITIATSLSRFENMVLTDLEIPRDSKTGAALCFTATFQQITIVTNLRTTVRTIKKRTAKPSGQGQENLGKQMALFGVDGPVIWVVTGRVASRATLSKSFGPPILTDSYGDHYKLQDNWATRPDGYIGKDNRYYPFTAAQYGSSTTTVPASINGRPVTWHDGIRNPDGTYVHGGGTWVDDQNNTITKTVPPGMDHWNGIIDGYPAR